MKSISAMIAVMTTTAVTVYFIWQFILGVPVLQSFVGIVSVMVILLGEITYIWWYFTDVKALHHKNKMERMVRNSSIAAVSPPKTLVKRRPQRLKSSLLLALPTLLFTSMFASMTGTLLRPNQQQIGDSSYLHVYGHLAFTDQLQQPGQWQESQRDFSGSRCQFIDGSYHVSQEHQRMMFPCPSTSSFKNFAFEAGMIILKGDCGGVNVRKDLFFAVCQEGNYLLLTQKNLESAIVSSPGTATSVIKRGVHQQNMIAIIAQDTSVTLFINRQKVQVTRTDSLIESPLNFIALSEERSTEVAYTHATVWSL